MGVALLKLTGMILQVLFFVRYDVVKQVCFYLLSLKLVVCRCLQLKMFREVSFLGLGLTFREATPTIRECSLHLCQMISTLKKGFSGKWNQPLAASFCLILVFDWFWLFARVAPFRDSSFREETGHNKLTSWLHCITFTIQRLISKIWYHKLLSYIVDFSLKHISNTSLTLSINVIITWATKKTLVV